MIFEIGFGVASAVAGIYVYKHYKMAAVVAAVKAEVAKIEAEYLVNPLITEVEKAVSSAVARLKALL